MNKFLLPKKRKVKRKIPLNKKKRVFQNKIVNQAQMKNQILM